MEASFEFPFTFSKADLQAEEKVINSMDALSNDMLTEIFSNLGLKFEEIKNARLIDKKWNKVIDRIVIANQIKEFKQTIAHLIQNIDAKYVKQIDQLKKLQNFIDPSLKDFKEFQTFLIQNRNEIGRILSELEPNDLQSIKMDHLFEKLFGFKGIDLEIQAMSTLRFIKDDSNKFSALQNIIQKLCELQQLEMAIEVFELAKTDLSGQGKELVYMDSMINSLAPSIIYLLENPTEKNLEKIHQLFSSIPDVLLKTSIIVGLPEELTQQETSNSVIKWLLKEGKYRTAAEALDYLPNLDEDLYKNLSTTELQNVNVAKIKALNNILEKLLKSSLSHKFNQAKEIVDKILPPTISDPFLDTSRKKALEMIEQAKIRLEF